jgi:2-keto-4-pentenoate hydratase/2-oxohepta-3-ene-1,7-dioic acid hydratase in catechol pathway
VGLVVDDTVQDLRPSLGDDVRMIDLLGDWEARLLKLRALAGASSRPGTPLAALRPLPPIEPCGQVLCAGANYHKHVRQIAYATGRVTGDARSDAERIAAAEEEARSRTADDPFVFAVPPSALSGATDDVVLRGPGLKHDWELELGVVLCRGGLDIPESEAMNHVAGFTMVNDISTRDVMQRPGFPLTDFLMAKGRPTFKPVGPYLLPREFVPDYRSLRITLTVNGQVMQDEGVEDIIHGVERLISYASTVVALRPGDLLLTGSPAGNAGHHGDRWLTPGDVLESQISGLGRQRNRCVAAGDG